MIANRLFKALTQRGMQQALATSQATPMFNMPARFFSDKENKEVDAAEAAEPVAAAEAEPTPAPKAKAAKAAPKKAEAPKSAGGPAFDVPLAKELFQPFSLGTTAKVESTADHKPPSEEDTIEGRYSGVLFTTASQKGQLYSVYEDLMYIKEIYRNSVQFQLFVSNQGVGNKEITKLNQALKETAPFCDTTLHFLTVLAENKRLNCINAICEKYAKLYQE